MALLSVHRALLGLCMALLSVHRAICRAFFFEYIHGPGERILNCYFGYI